MICPRRSILPEYRLTLKVKDKGTLLSFFKKFRDVWVKVSLSLETKEKERVVDSLMNRQGTLSCAVIAVRAEILRFHRIDKSGNVGGACSLRGLCHVLAISSNRQLTSLQHHANTSSDTILMIDPLRHVIGADNPQTLLLDEIVPNDAHLSAKSGGLPFIKDGTKKDMAMSSQLKFATTRLNIDLERSIMYQFR